jgi:hypothetical protein
MGTVKLDWKKTEKALYLPGADPQMITVPALKFFSLRGRGNPNSIGFQDYVGVLYSLAYAVRMSYKTPDAPAGYAEYTVYPLEGVWDISEEAKAKAKESQAASAQGMLDKDQFVFKLMIRQPGFVTPEFAARMVDSVRKKKPVGLLDSVGFGAYEEGVCVQMTHVGTYDAEPASFARMEEFCAANGMARKSKVHREIYLSDPRSVDPEKLRTVLRFQVVRV